MLYGFFISLRNICLQKSLHGLKTHDASRGLSLWLEPIISPISYGLQG